MILAGGAGTRFWPASTPGMPKQALPLLSERPIVAETLDRARALTDDAKIHVLANARIGDTLRTLVPDLAQVQLWEEPVSAGTGPALAFAAHAVAREDPSGVIVSLHADHLIDPMPAFVSTLERAIDLARQGGLFTLGARPTRPESGFGYIRPAGPGGDPEWGVEEFVEKPDPERAARLVEGGWLWNTGIFIWRADAFLDELGKCAPDIASLLPRLSEGDVEGFFRAAPKISVDRAVLERTVRLGVVPASFEWDDLGSWESVARIRNADGSGNVAVGTLHAVESSGNIAYTSDGTVVLLGVSDLVVVRTPDVTFVAPRSRAADLRPFVEGLPPALRDT